MVTGTDGGYHETGTSTPKVSFYETYTDEDGNKQRRVHKHTWQLNLIHTCVQKEAPVIHSVVTGDAIQMQRFSPKQLDELKMMASTNIPKPCLYRIMLSMNPGVTWDYQTFISQVKTLRRQLKNERPIRSSSSRRCETRSSAEVVRFPSTTIQAATSTTS